MADTPIIDAAVRAGCDMGEECLWPSEGCNQQGCALSTAAVVMDALRAALPWDLPAERLEAMAVPFLPHKYEKLILAAYRGDPIMRELYPERFNVAA
jgi:hypothetical protein